MTEKVKRPVARRTLWLAIEKTLADTEALTLDSTIEDLLDCIKDDWFKQAK